MFVAAITEGGIFCGFTAAEDDFLFLGKLNNFGEHAGLAVIPVAERLFLRKAAGTPGITARFDLNWIGMAMIVAGHAKGFCDFRRPRKRTRSFRNN